MPSFEPTTLRSSSNKTNTTGSVNVSHITKTKVELPADTTIEPISQTLETQPPDTKSPIIPPSTEYATIIPNVTTAPSNSTSSVFSSTTPSSTYTSSQVGTMDLKFGLSESQSVNSITTRSDCISCDSASMQSTVMSTTSVASTTGSAAVSVHDSRSSEGLHIFSVSSSTTSSIHITASDNQTTETILISPSSTRLNNTQSTRPSVAQTTSMRFRTRHSRSSSKTSLLSSISVTARIQSGEAASSTADSPTTVQTVSAGNDTILVLPRAAVVTNSPTQSTGSTSAKLPTALPSVDPAQHAKDVAKLAEIIVPSVVGGTGLSITVSWAIWRFLHKTAVAEGKVGSEILEEQSAIVQRFAQVGNELRLSEDTSWPRDIDTDIDVVADIENRILEEEAVHPGTLTAVQKVQTEGVINAPSPLRDPLPGDTPIEAPPTVVEMPELEPFDGEPRPPVYDDPKSVELAEKLPPMGQPEKHPGSDIIFREVPRAYKYLSFDAKINYASKYGMNVWSRGLHFPNGMPAGVGPDNKPLNRIEHLELDDDGNIVSYMGIPIEDLENLGFPRTGSWEQQQAKLRDIKNFANGRRRSITAERAEMRRVKAEQKRYQFEKKQARIQKMEQRLQQIREDRQRKELEANLERLRQEREEIEQRNKAKEDADRKAKEEADRKAKEEADQKAKEEANTDTDELNDPRNINVALWKHKPYCADAPGPQSVRCVDIIGMIPPPD